MSTSAIRPFLPGLAAAVTVAISSSIFLMIIVGIKIFFGIFSLRRSRLFKIFVVHLDDLVAVLANYQQPVLAFFLFDMKVTAAAPGTTSKRLVFRHLQNPIRKK